MAGRHRTIPIFVPHRGCPQDCRFCNQKRITGQNERMTPDKAHDIIAEGLRGKQESDYIEVGFFGGSFTGIPVDEQEAFLSIARKFLMTGELDGIRLSTRPDYINETVLERLSNFGVTTVELGAQSMNDGVLAQCRRGHTAAQTRRAAEQIKANGFGLGLQMMIGLPGDTHEQALETARQFIALQPDCVRIYPTLVIQDTALAEDYRAGSYAPLSVEEAVRISADLYRMFTQSHIAVIRMGLLDMEPDSIVAGPFHPAFGELVLSRACYHDLAQEAETVSGKTITIRTNPRYVSVLVGQKRSNIERLQKEFDLQNITVIQDETVPEGTFLLSE